MSKRSPKKTRARHGSNRRKRKQEQEEELAPLIVDQQDPLTGVANADSIRSIAEATVFEAAQKGYAVSFACIDMDDFAETNRVFGYELGDQFLLALLDLIKSFEFNETPEIGRLAGDLFLLVFKNVEPEEAFIELEGLRAQISEAEIVAGDGESERTHRCTISVGVAGFPKDGLEARAVLTRSLNAVRRAKKLGRDKVGLPPDDRMVTKTSHYSKVQLETLREIAKFKDRNEADLLREALDDLLLKFKERPPV